MRRRFPQELHQLKPIWCLDSLIYRLFHEKRHESWTDVVLLLGSGLRFDNQDTTKAFGDLK
jgi:hypothetical protein